MSDILELLEKLAPGLKTHEQKLVQSLLETDGSSPRAIMEYLKALATKSPKDSNLPLNMLILSMLSETSSVTQTLEGQLSIQLSSHVTNALLGLSKQASEELSLIQKRKEGLIGKRVLGSLKKCLTKPESK